MCVTYDYSQSSFHSAHTILYQYWSRFVRFQFVMEIFSSFDCIRVHVNVKLQWKNRYESTIKSTCGSIIMIYVFIGIAFPYWNWEYWILYAPMYMGSSKYSLTLNILFRICGLRNTYILIILDCLWKMNLNIISTGISGKHQHNNINIMI